MPSRPCPTPGRAASPAARPSARPVSPPSPQALPGTGRLPGFGDMSLGPARPPGPRLQEPGTRRASPETPAAGSPTCAARAESAQRPSRPVRVPSGWVKLTRCVAQGSGKSREPSKPDGALKPFFGLCPQRPFRPAPPEAPSAWAGRRAPPPRIPGGWAYVSNMVNSRSYGQKKKKLIDGGCLSLKSSPSGSPLPGPPALPVRFRHYSALNAVTTYLQRDCSDSDSLGSEEATQDPQLAPAVGLFAKRPDVKRKTDPAHSLAIAENSSTRRAAMIYANVS